jgi:ubiquinone/menaquinone biosynthesis C-methylase UbiE
MISLRPFRRVARWSVMTAGTALLARWLRLAVDARPLWREFAGPATCVPAAARNLERLADTPLWRLGEQRVARYALRPFRVRPTLRRLRVLHLDHGPGGLSAALAAEAPQDSTVVAADSLPGMADLARHRAARRGHRAALPFVQSWSFDLPFHDGAIDLVVTVGSMHHWPNPERVLREISRVLAPDGRYVVLDFRRDLPLGLWLLARLIQTALTPRDLRAMDEPSVSIASSFTANEAEWLAARAKLPDLCVPRGRAWIAIERAG